MHGVGYKEVDEVALNVMSEVEHAEYFILRTEPGLGSLLMNLIF